MASLHFRSPSVSNSRETNSSVQDSVNPDQNDHEQQRVTPFNTESQRILFSHCTKADVCCKFPFAGHGFSPHDSPSNKSPLLSHKTTAPNPNMTSTRCSFLKRSIRSDSGSRKSLCEYFLKLERFGRALINFLKSHPQCTEFTL